jgi:hypothetical protein
VALETTAELIQRTVDSLPAWPESWNGGSAFRNLSPDESSYSIRRMKWRMKHQPSGTCYLKVWLQKKFVPESGSTVITPLTPYEWTGTGNPCLPDPEKTYTHPDNAILGTETEEQEPATDGTVTIEIVKWSCVEGYEPGSGEPNGFPSP